MSFNKNEYEKDPHHLRDFRGLPGAFIAIVTAMGLDEEELKREELLSDEDLEAYRSL